ncbi:MAG: transglutaminase family protein [Acidimicrobiales bacterium]|nr:transglutaminase family protein [Hyphomonadaceae bacterium]RZV42786.1 MAG: transglutaminase family protein [Acidimicrobiales bacterium]
MHLKIKHTTSYHYQTPASYALQQIRLRPLANKAQKILSWELSLEGAEPQVQFMDQFENHVDLILLKPDAKDVVISFEGEVETYPTSGVAGQHNEPMPLWFYKHQTALTKNEIGVSELVKDIGSTSPDNLQALHQLSALILSRVSYQTGETNTFTTAEQAIMAGKGVCQDHTHIFVSAARELGFPARYISGYLMMNERIDQEASHAWAEAYVDGLGWVGFDVSNGISPDERYVQIARGLDYRDAAPSTGVIIGAQQENLVVSIQVQQ